MGKTNDDEVEKEEHPNITLTQKATQVFKGEANISKMNKHLNKQTIGKSFDATTGALAFSGDLQDLH